MKKRSNNQLNLSRNNRYTWLLIAGAFFLVLAYVAQQFLPDRAEPAQQVSSAMVTDGFHALPAKVTRVADGDTVQIKSKEGSTRVRLLGIDAPELKMPFGEESKRSLENMVRNAGGEVTVYYKRKDAYGRIVGKLVANGEDLNLEQIRTGNAWAYRNYLKDTMPGDKSKYIQAEETAQRKVIGLWQQADPEKPWVWRQSHRRD